MANIKKIYQNLILITIKNQIIPNGFLRGSIPRWEQRKFIDMKKNNFKDLEHLKKLKNLISDKTIDEDGKLIRYVNGKKIIQIPEKTIEDIRKNEAINLWRMRNLK